MERDERLLDPICGLIAFRRDVSGDQLAWELVQTSVFQRLRRIRQLGLAELVFPGATHSRFSHSLGVFDTARQILAQLKRRLGSAYDEDAGQVALLAALLHDIGHGPMSHVFERCMGKNHQSHEGWSAKIIREEESLSSLLPLREREAIAALLEGKSSANAYASLVSSQFDADRLDYLRRDRYMTGVKSGGFDFFWLLDCLDITPKDMHPSGVLCLRAKGLRNAEEYLLARYHLYSNVYLHKTTRAAEFMLEHVFQALREAPDLLGQSDPLRHFLESASPSRGAYLALDDMVVWQSLAFLARQRKTTKAGVLASRLLARDFYKPEDISLRSETERDVLQERAKAVGGFVDRIPFSAYGLFHLGTPQAKEKILIYDEREKSVRDIAEISLLVGELTRPRHLIRLYFPDSKSRAQALGGAK